jgi:hypothetical protein
MPRRIAPSSLGGVSVAAISTMPAPNSINRAPLDSEGPPVGGSSPILGGEPTPPGTLPC